MTTVPVSDVVSSSDDLDRLAGVGVAASRSRRDIAGVVHKMSVWRARSLRC